MVRWHLRLNGHEYAQLWEMVTDRESWHVAVHGGHKESDITDQLDNNNNMQCFTQKCDLKGRLHLGVDILLNK